MRLNLILGLFLSRQQRVVELVPIWESQIPLLDCTSLLHLVVVTVPLRHDLLDVPLHEVFSRDILGPSHEFALRIDEGLRVRLVEHFEEDVGVGEVKLFAGLRSDILEGDEHLLDLDYLRFLRDVVQIRAEEEPYSVREEKVDLARLAEDVADVLLLDLVQLVVQVEAAELRDEELEVRPHLHSFREVWVQPHPQE